MSDEMRDRVVRIVEEMVEAKQLLLRAEHLVIAEAAPCVPPRGVPE
jgi:hypothetical protein